MSDESTFSTNANSVHALELNRRLALRFLEHAFSNRVDQALALLTEDATWWVIGSPERLKVSGTKQRLQIDRLLKGIARLVPGGMKMNVGGTTAEGNRVAVEVSASGIWIDGRIYRNTYHFLFELRNGAIMAIREYMDCMQVVDILENGAVAQ